MKQTFHLSQGYSIALLFVSEDEVLFFSCQLKRERQEKDYEIVRLQGEIDNLKINVEIEKDRKRYAESRMEAAELKMRTINNEFSFVKKKIRMIDKIIKVK